MFWYRRRKAIPREVRQEVLEADGVKCSVCRDDRVAFLTVDHIWPHALGGTYERSNLRVLCASCNSAKGGYMSPAELMRRHPEVRVGDLVYEDQLGLCLSDYGASASTDERSRVFLQDDVAPVFVPEKFREQVTSFVQALRSQEPERFPAYVDGSTVKSAEAEILERRETPSHRAAQLRRRPRKGRYTPIETAFADRVPFVRKATP